MWNQRSRVYWLKEDDKNTKLFHTKASNRRKQNRVTSLKNEEGVWLEGDRLAHHMVSYFSKLFSTSGE